MKPHIQSYLTWTIQNAFSLLNPLRKLFYPLLRNGIYKSLCFRDTELNRITNQPPAKYCLHNLFTPWVRKWRCLLSKHIKKWQATSVNMAGGKCTLPHQVYRVAPNQFMKGMAPTVFWPPQALWLCHKVNIPFNREQRGALNRSEMWSWNNDIFKISFWRSPYSRLIWHANLLTYSVLMPFLSFNMLFNHLICKSSWFLAFSITMSQWRCNILNILFSVVTMLCVFILRNTSFVLDIMPSVAL